MGNIWHPGKNVRKFASHNMRNENPGADLFTPDILEKFQQALHTWFRAAQRSLPWRETRDAYRIWVSEVMLQQTQVATVMPYFERFVAAFPTITDLAAADQQAVLKLWEGLGYYARARNLHKAARTVAEKHGGKIPANYAEFRQLAGVGDYIAAAVQSIAFGRPHAVVDGNVKRVLARLFLLDAPVNHSGAAKIYQETAAALLDHRRPGDFNQAMMELGALVCRPQTPLCEQCPVGSFCQARRHNRQQEFPQRNPRPHTPEYRHAIAVIYRKQYREGQYTPQFLIVQRPATGLLGGLWEFPGDNIHPGESPGAACRRIAREALNLSITPRQYLFRIKHAFTHFKLTGEVFLCEGDPAGIILRDATAFHWAPLPELSQFPFSKVNQQIISRLSDPPLSLNFGEKA